MKRSLMVIAILICAAALIWAQDSSMPTPMSSAPTSAAPSGQAKQTPTPTQSAPAQGQKQPQQGQGMPMAGMQAHMGDMQAMLNRMTALLNQMRATYASMDPKDQPAMQANIEMWQAMLNHLKNHMQECPMMQGKGEGMMMHHQGQGPMHGPGGHAHPGMTNPPPPPAAPSQAPPQ